MKLTTNRYTAILTLQTFLLTIDWIMNIVGLVATQTNASMVTLLIVQDACILVALSTLLFTFFSTYLFKNGLVYLLYERFRTSLVICMFYFILTTILHVWSIATKWSTSRYSWSTSYVVLLVLQRLTATIYYYCYKRASLRISDQRFYEDMDSGPIDTIADERRQIG